eukprot:3806218-Pyramimonas_sp.AAC.1
MRGMAWDSDGNPTLVGFSFCKIICSISRPVTSSVQFKAQQQARDLLDEDDLLRGLPVPPILRAPPRASHRAR